MAQDNTLSVVTSQSLHFMRDYPPPSTVFKTEPGSMNMNALHSPLPLPPPQAVMTQVQQSQWIPAPWIPPPVPMGQIPLGPVAPVRPIRPRRRTELGMFPRVGPPMWRGTRFVRSGWDGFNQVRKPHLKYQNSQHKADEESSNAGSCTENSKSNGLSVDGPNKSTTVSVKEENSNADLEKCLGKGVRKRKPISKFYTSKPWNRQDAERALKVELEAEKKQVKTLIIKFPDPDLSWDKIRSYHSAIEKVHFLVPSAPRYCFIQLSDDSDVDQVISDLKEIEFHNLGKIKVEKKFEKPEGNVDPESIDPYTLYLGNLPLTINPTLIKEKFPTAARIDVGYAQKMKYTRYAFIRYQTVEESIEAFKSSHNVIFDSRNLIVRFRRQKGKNTMAVDLGTKLARKERRKLIERKRRMEDLKKIVEKKIKKEKIDKSEENYEPTLSDIIRKVGDLEDDQESEEEEKEVDDDDDEDDDDDDDEVDYVEAWKEENIKEEEEEEEEEEEDDEEDDDEDEEEGD